VISFELTDEQKEMKELARKFTKNEIIPVASELDNKAEMPMEIIKKAFEIGLWNFNIPLEYGGLGLNHITESILLEEIAYGCLGIHGAWAGNSLGLSPIIIAGNDEQKNQWLTQFIHEPLFAAFCITEPDAGSDVSAMRTKAKKDGEYYILNGVKHFITHGGISRLHTIFARTDNNDKGARGLSAFLVSGNSDGLLMGKVEDKMGDRASHISEVILEDVKVPACNLLGNEGSGFKIAMQTLDRTRMSIGAAAVGVARRAYEEALEYSKNRVQFGKPICRHQSIAFMLADMATEIEAARALVWHAAWQMDNGNPSPKLGAMSKLFAADMAMKITVDAVQIFGGYGYIKEYPVEKLMRDAKILQIYEGTQQIQRIVISNNILS
jgi:acyl-CoA dehydrogenase